MAKGNRGGKGGSGGGDEGTGAIRRYGGGKGVSSDDIVSTSSMISTRESNPRAVDEALSTFKAFNEKYGTEVSDINVAKIKMKSGTLAYYATDWDNVGFNESFFNADKMNRAYDETVKTGFHPSRGNKTGIEAVTAHELGHKLTADVMNKIGSNSLEKTATVIVKEARKSTNHRGVVRMENAISRYATANNSEAIAEAVADVYCNGSKAKQESHAIVSVVEKYLK